MSLIKIKRNRKGNLLLDNLGSVTMVVMLIGTIAALVLGVYILATFQGGMPTIDDPTANATATNIFGAGWNAFGLAVVIPIIVVAGAVLGYLVRGLVGGTGGR